MPYPGVHISTSGGLAKAVERASTMGATSLQIFTSSPMMWREPKLDQIDWAGFIEAKKKFGIKKSFIHSLYLVNLASDSPSLVEKSSNALITDMKACSLGEMDGIIVHLGSHQGRGFTAMKEQMIAEIKKILAVTPENSRFLIENSAGQNGKIGSDLQEIRELINGVGSNRLGWCFDTCHAYSAGYHLGSHGADANQPSLLSESQKIKLAFDEIDHLSLWETLWCIHTNDSRDDYDSGRDRHENLGKGKIPVPEFMDWLNQSKLKDHALILEVPGIDNKGPDEANLKVLKGWIKR